MNKESKINKVSLIMRFLLIIVQFFIISFCLYDDTDGKSYCLGMVMGIIPCLICSMKFIVKKVVGWFDE